MKQVLSMLLLFVKIIPIPLHKFSSFLLVSLILSSKSWSLRLIILDNAIFMLSLVSYSLIEEITFLIFWRVFTLFWMSFVPLWIIIKLGFLRTVGRFTNSGSVHEQVLFLLGVQATRCPSNCLLNPSDLWDGYLLGLVTNLQKTVIIGWRLCQLR